MPRDVYPSVGIPRGESATLPARTTDRRPSRIREEHSVDPSATARQCGHLTRRAILRAGAGALAVAAAPRLVAAQATPAPDDPARVAAFVALSEALVGGGRIDPDRAAQALVSLQDADPASSAKLDEMLAAGPDAVLANPADFPQAKPLLLYWYQGSWKGQAVAGRDTFWYGLSSWQAVKYTSSTGICKRFGDWATAPRVV